jgi:hypothetical protein
VLLVLQPLTTTAYPLRVLPAKRNIKFKVVGGSPAAITNDLPSAVCWVSQMASSSISYFLLLRQNKVAKERRPRFAAASRCPALLDWSGGCGTRATRSNGPRRNPLTSLRYSAAHRGRKAKTRNTCSGQHVADYAEVDRQNNSTPVHWSLYVIEI